MMGGGMGKKSKPNDMMEAWKDIFRYIGRYKILFSFLEMSLRNICAQRCDTVAIM